MCVQCILTLVDENTSSPIAYKLLVVKSNTRINMRTTRRNTYGQLSTHVLCNFFTNDYLQTYLNKTFL